MRIIALFLLLMAPLHTLSAQHLEELARSMVLGKDTSCSRKSYHHFLSLLDDQRLGTTHIQKTNGVAISPEAAAHCMLEHTRTQVFVEGLYRAAKSLKKEQIQVLYIGCGPFAPFMTLTAPLLPDARYTLVEISKNAAETAEVLIQRLGLQAQLDTLIIADATELILTDANQYDIIITETMDAGLGSEMMMPILIHILPQLRKDVVLIPEDVFLELCLVPKSSNSHERHPIFKATDLLQCRSETRQFPETKIALPDSPDITGYVSTTVKVFGDIYLFPGESAITRKLPVRLKPGKTMCFSYAVTPPGIKISYPEQKQTP